MPTFRVKGCFEENAEDVELVIQASSYKDAERIANKKGILVSDVLVVEESTSSESNIGDWYKPKKRSVKQKLIKLLIVGFIFSAVITSIVEMATTDKTRSSTTSGSSKESSRDEKIKKLFHWYDASHTNSINIIKRALHNPDSFELVETVFWDMQNHLIVKTTYRAENGFGALRTNWIKTKIDMDGNVLQVIEQSE